MNKLETIVNQRLYIRRQLQKAKKLNCTEELLNKNFSNEYASYEIKRLDDTFSIRTIFTSGISLNEYDEFYKLVYSDRIL